MAWPSLLRMNAAQMLQARARRRAAVILVHDFCLTPTHLEQLRSQLLARDHKVRVPQLPSSGSMTTPNAIDADMQVILAAALPELQTGLDVVIIMFGYGAIPGTIAAQRLNAWSLETPRAGRVSKLVFAAALLLNRGEAVRDILTDTSARFEMVTHDRCRLRRDIATTMFEPCPSQSLSRALTSLQDLSCNTLTTPVTSQPWASIPAVYIICERDAALSVAQQQFLAARLQSANHRTVITRLHSGHAPFLTHARELATLITQLTEPRD